MSVLAFKNITKRFGSLVANDKISFDVKRGEVLALLGENGAGKTTLMNILFGHYQADQGRIEVDGRPLPGGSTDASIKAGVGMVHQQFVLADNLTVLENVILGTESLWSWRHDDATARRKIASLAETFGLAINANALVADLSVGERQRVEILKALYRDSRILILDEPTAVLTPAESEQLFSTLNALTADGLAIIFISHKLNEILAVSDRVAVLRAGKLIGIVETKNADRHQLASMMVGREVTRPTLAPIEAGDSVLEVQGLSLSSEGGGLLLDDVSLDIRAHEIVGIAGVAGNGQRDLADVLSGLCPNFEGRINFLDETVKAASPRRLVERGVGRIPEDRHGSGVVGEMAVWENLASEEIRSKEICRAGFIDKNAAVSRAERMIETFDIRCQGPDAETRLLSGGNMQKLILARTLSREPRFILANQPARGLDEGAIAYVQSQLLAARERGAGILLISEDLDELLALTDRLAVIHQGHLSEARPTSSWTITDLGLAMSTQRAPRRVEAGQEGVGHAH
ncbi:MAG: ABC transporter ATP-binding protein [Geminicoccaceae bacterium]